MTEKRTVENSPFLGGIVVGMSLGWFNLLFGDVAEYFGAPDIPFYASSIDLILFTIASIIILYVNYRILKANNMFKRKEK